MAIKETTERPTLVSYLDLRIEIHNDRSLSTKLYDKRDEFNCAIVNFPFISSNILSARGLWRLDFSFIELTMMIHLSQGRNLPLCNRTFAGIHSEPVHLRATFRTTFDDVTDESAFLMDAFRSDVSYEQIQETDKKRVTYLNGKKNCPQILKYDEPTCPSYYIMNFNPERRPKVIFEAKCSCRLCRTDKGNATGRCSAIYYYRPVLQMDRTGRRCYERVLGKFSVGCECIGAETEIGLSVGSVQ